MKLKTNYEKEKMQQWAAKQKLINQHKDQNNQLEQPNTFYRCRICKDEKPLISKFFFKDLTRKNGFNTACKICIAKRDKHPSRIYSFIKSQAKQRNLEFSLSKEQYNNIIKNNCYLCNSKTIGWLDRIDSKKGYTINNVRSACATCNKMKLSTPKNDFLAHIAKIYHFNTKKLDTLSL